MKTFIFLIAIAGCIAPAQLSAKNSFAKDTLILTATQKNVTCNGGRNGSATVTAKNSIVMHTGNTFTYSWAPSGGAQANATDLSAGIYTVTVTDMFGNKAAEVIKITQPALLRDSISAQTCSLIKSGTARVGVKGGTLPYSYTWAPEGNKGGTTYLYTALSSGTYTVTVTDKNKCVATATATVESCDDAPVTNHSDVTTTDDNKVTLYPNPNMGQFAINGLELGAAVEIYNSMGMLVKTIEVKDITMQFNASDLPSGVYLIRIISNDGTILAQPKMVKAR